MDVYLWRCYSSTTLREDGLFWSTTRASYFTRPAELKPIISKHLNGKLNAIVSEFQPFVIVIVIVIVIVRYQFFGLFLTCFQCHLFYFHYSAAKLSISLHFLNPQSRSWI